MRYWIGHTGILPIKSCVFCPAAKRQPGIPGFRDFTCSELGKRGKKTSVLKCGKAGEVHPNCPLPDTIPQNKTLTTKIST